MINNRENINVKDFISAMSGIDENTKVVNVGTGLELINGILRNVFIITLDSGKRVKFEMYEDKE